MQHMQFSVTLEAQPEGGFTAQCLEIPGAISQGNSEREALDNIRDAIAELLAARRARASGAMHVVEVDA